jgi:hypothetical protein
MILEKIHNDRMRFYDLNPESFLDRFLFRNRSFELKTLGFAIQIERSLLFD